MAEKSEFLPFQDADGDGLIDLCKDVVTPPDPKECPKCVPNPHAIVPNWHPLTHFEPFLNERNCHYQVAMVAKKYTNMGLVDPENATEEAALLAIEGVFDEYFEEAIKGMLKIHNKDDSASSIEKVKEAIIHEKYWLDPRPLTNLRLLYSVPKEYIDDLPDRSEDEEDSDDGPIEVTFNTAELPSMMMRMRKTLRLYNRYLNVYRGIDGGNILKVKDSSLFPLEV